MPDNRDDPSNSRGMKRDRSDENAAAIDVNNRAVRPRGHCFGSTAQGGQHALLHHEAYHSLQTPMDQYQGMDMVRSLAAANPTTLSPHQQHLLSMIHMPGTSTNARGLHPHMLFGGGGGGGVTDQGFRNLMLSGMFSSGEIPPAAAAGNFAPGLDSTSSSLLYGYPQSLSLFPSNFQAAPNQAPVTANITKLSVPNLSLNNHNASASANNRRVQPVETATVIGNQKNYPQDDDSTSSSDLGLSSHPSGRAVTLYVPSDDDSISPFQCLARKHIELFEASQADIDCGAQGRNKPITLGQVGIRCKHCKMLPPNLRARAAVYYPSKLHVLYQAAQNIVNVHLPELCDAVPDDVRDQLLSLGKKKSSVGGGKNYWSDAAQILGIRNTEQHGLRFEDSPFAK